MIRSDAHPFATAMDTIAAADLARPLSDLAGALRLAGFREGRRATGPQGTRAFPTSMDAGLERLRALRVSYAALARPETFEASLALGPPILNGIDVSPPVLEAFSMRHVSAARDVLASVPPNPPILGIGDASGRVPLDTTPFETRYLSLRFLRVLDPTAHAAIAGADPERVRAADLVAGWWSERIAAALSDAGTADRPGRVAAFRARLCESVALTGVEEVDMDYDPDAWLGEALDEADVPAHEMRAWRKSVAWINAREGTVLARIGVRGDVETVGSYREAPLPAKPAPLADPGMPGPLDVAAFLIGASLPGAILRRIPGALAVAVPSADQAEPTCLFVAVSGSGLVAVDDGRTLSRLEGDLDGIREVLGQAGLKAVPDAGEIRLELPGLDGVGARLSAMAEAIRTVVRPRVSGAA
jgi:hypothetical protein